MLAPAFGDESSELESDSESDSESESGSDSDIEGQDAMTVSDNEESDGAVVLGPPVDPLRDAEDQLWIDRFCARLLSLHHLPPPGVPRDSGLWDWVYFEIDDIYLASHWFNPSEHPRMQLSGHDDEGMYFASEVVQGEVPVNVFSSLAP